MKSIFDCMYVSNGGKINKASNIINNKHISSYEKGLQNVQATGNKWAEENYKATHNKNNGAD